MSKDATHSAKHWHTLGTDEAHRLLATPPEGLSAAEAAARLEQYGPNTIEGAAAPSPLLRLARQFHNVLIYVLLAAAVVTVLLQEWVDTGVIIAVVLINAAIGFIQEGKAEKALEAIRDMLAPHALVLRDGRKVDIDASRLVPGDIVFLKSGDMVPADLRLLESASLQIQEAALTGESVPSDKATDTLAADTALGDRTNMGFAGTLVTYGKGTGIVTATGRATQIGQVSEMLADVQTLTTPLTRKMQVFGRWLTAFIIIFAAATFAFGLLIRDYGMDEMFMVAVGLAVAAIPEGLPAIMTITLAIGVTRMARRNAIIRRLPAIETLGSVTVICSDKTGTLTLNEMFAQTVATSERSYDITGEGYIPDGAFHADGTPLVPDRHDDLMQLARAALLCNDGSLTSDAQGQWTMTGNPTDGALLAMALKTGMDAKDMHDRFPRTGMIPFDSAHKYMATLHHDHEGHGYIYLKGAPERVLELCGDIDHALWTRKIDALAAEGNRVLAIAMKSRQDDKTTLSFDDVERGGLQLLGLIGLIDPPREEAVEAVARCQAAGIRVKMITGDHAETARAIAGKLGLIATDRAITGHDIDAMDDRALLDAARTVDVFARTTPAHKLRLVELLQQDQQIVAMTGDGVNDAPALKRADIGVAMGKKGTEAAKRASEMVLADDNFASIAQAVENGRTVYDNIKKTIMFILPTNGGQAVLIIAAILLGFTLPITPVQILWVNMVTAVTLGLALAFEPPEPNVMARPPRPVREPIFSGFLLWRLLFVVTLMVAAAFGLFSWQYQAGVDIDTARTLAVNMIVFAEIAYLFNARLLLAPSLTRDGLFGSRAVLLSVGLIILFQLAFTYLPVMQTLFGTAPLVAGHWTLILIFAALIFAVIECEKFVLRRQRKTNS